VLAARDRARELPAVRSMKLKAGCEMRKCFSQGGENEGATQSQEPISARAKILWIVLGRALLYNVSSSKC
jgi:hypothetical protein